MIYGHKIKRCIVAMPPFESDDDLDTHLWMACAWYASQNGYVTRIRPGPDMIALSKGASGPAVIDRWTVPGVVCPTRETLMALDRAMVRLFAVTEYQWEP